MLAINCLCRWSLSYSIASAHLCLQEKFTEELEQKVDLNQVRKSNLNNKEDHVF